MSKGLQAAAAPEPNRPAPSTSNSQHASPSQPLIKRVHISGLTPALTPQDIASRFSSFGLEVLAVEPWMVPDQRGSASTSTGEDKTYTFMNVALPPASDEQATQQVKAKLERAKRLLSGSVWKGAKLRIGDAKPDWRQRHEAEMAREEHLDDNKKKGERSAKVPGTVGTVATNASEPVTKEVVKEGEWGWKKTPAGHLVRPMQMRPSRPISAPALLNADSKVPSAKSKDKQPAASTSTSPSKSKPTGDDSKKRKKDANKQSKRTLKRARVLTIDPTRYPRSHLSGPFLEQGADGEDADADLQEGSHWECEELAEEEASEESDEIAEMSGKGEKRNRAVRSDEVKWVLRDKENNIIRTEVVPRKRLLNGSKGRGERKAEKAPNSHVKKAGLSIPAELRQSSPELSTASSSSSEEDQKADNQGHGEASASGADLESEASASLAPEAAWKLEAYDPEAESDFSDGYDEAEATKKVSATLASGADFATERSGTMNLLSKMFGDDVKNAGSAMADEPAPHHAGESDEDEEWWSTLRGGEKGVKAPAVRAETASAEKGTKAASQKEQESASFAASRDRRAALLASASASAGQEGRAGTAGYQPIARYVPSQPEEKQTITEEQAMEEQSQSEDLPNEDAAESVPPSPQEAANSEKLEAQPKGENMVGMQYQLESLKDMFKPQEAESGGFSLMAGLDIELDEEMNFDLVVEQEAQMEARHQDAVESEPAPVRPATIDESAKIVPHSFPLFDPSNPRDPIQLLQKGLYIPFCRTDTEEEIVARWEERKGRLTQEYKRRHREAVKKKKRRVTGSRAAGSAGGAVRGARAADE